MGSMMPLPERDKERHDIAFAFGMSLESGSPEESDEGERITVDLESRVSDVMEPFAADRPPETQVVVKRSADVVANVTLLALATLMLRVTLAKRDRSTILEWAERSGEYWCARGAHFSPTEPCPTHGTA